VSLAAGHTNRMVVRIRQPEQRDEDDGDGDE